jgi:hypothetical protein
VYDAATDGVRFVVWGEGGAQSALVIRDDRTGVTRRVSLGRDCSYVLVAGASHRKVLASCRGPNTWMVVDVESGEMTPVGDEHTDECEAFGQIGRYWLLGAMPCNKGGSFYRNWHTGVEQGLGPTEGELRQPYDLDTPTLSALGPRRRVFVVGSSRVLSRLSTGRKRPRYVIELRGPGSPGSKEGDLPNQQAPPLPRRRFRCSSSCEPISIAGGLALWLDRGNTQLQGYALTKHRRLTWNMPVPAHILGATNTRVYYTTPNRSNQTLADVKSFRWR